MSDLLLPENTILHAELEIKRSRFLAEVSRVGSHDEARAQIVSRRSALPDARHHCTGFVVSVRGASPLFHSSDDGEPSGTAGRPILDVLTGAGITDVVAIVSRYFGGTLLGTGGLVRAYSGAVKEAIEGATVVSRQMVPVWQAVLPHKDAGRYLAELDNAGLPGTPDYQGHGVILTVPTSDGATLASLLAKLSGGTVRPKRAGEQTIEKPWGHIIKSVATPSN